MIQRQMIFWTFGLVAIFGVAVVFFLVQPPTSLKRDIAGSKGRLPASIVEDSGAPTNEIPILQVDDVTVGCEPNFEKVLAANVHQVRIRGEVCMPQAQSLTLVNSTNGFSATVFVPDAKRFATDYINLVDGENKLILQIQLENGNVQSREFKLVRQ